MKSTQIVDTQDHISQKAVRESTTNVVEAGAVLVVTRSGILKHTLPVALAIKRVAINQDLKALTPIDGVEPRFVAHFLRAHADNVLHDCSKDGLPFRASILRSCCAYVFHSRQVARSRLNVRRYRAATLDALNAGSFTSRGLPIDARTLALVEVLAEPLANGRSVPTRVRGFPVLRLTALRVGKIDLRERKPGDQIEARARTSAGIHKINQTDLEQVRLPRVAIHEQVRIVAETERRLSHADRLDAQIDSALKHATRLRQSILKRAFEGKLVAQDPNDEPASTLLTRIHAQKNGQRAKVPRGRPAKASIVTRG